MASSPFPLADATTPTYTVHRDIHGIPQFTPKRGTQALKDALIYTFPTLSTELELMQAALRQFFDSEKNGKRSSFICELPENSLQVSIAKEKLDDDVFGLSRPGSRLRSRRSILSSRASSRASSSRASSRAETSTPFEFAGGGGTMTTWCLSSGKELEKRKKGPYDAVKRRKVAENRGMACDKHRAAKTACNPESCLMNKLYGKDRRRSEVTTQSSVEAVSPAPSQNFETSTPSTDATFEVNLDMSMDFDVSTLCSSISSSAWPPTNSAEPLTWVHENGQSPIAAPASELTNPVQNQREKKKEAPSKAKEVSCFDCILDKPSTDTMVDPSLSSTPLEYGSDLFDSTSLLKEMDCDVVWSLPDEAMNVSEDPFMGWATKKANQTVEDYGWVLSHVGAL